MKSSLNLLTFWSTPGFSAHIEGFVKLSDPVFIFEDQSPGQIHQLRIGQILGDWIEFVQRLSVKIANNKPFRKPFTSNSATFKSKFDLMRKKICRGA